MSIGSLICAGVVGLLLGMTLNLKKKPSDDEND